MEIKLSEEDFERLAAVLERRITERVVGMAAQNPVWEVMSEQAKRLALIHVGSDTFRTEAVLALRKELQDGSKELLRKMVRDAVADVHANDPELKKAAARGVYEAARDAAERLRSPYEN